jgi:hypothetical protein
MGPAVRQAGWALGAGRVPSADGEARRYPYMIVGGEEGCTDYFLTILHGPQRVDS